MTRFLLVCLAIVCFVLIDSVARAQGVEPPPMGEGLQFSISQVVWSLVGLAFTGLTSLVAWVARKNVLLGQVMKGLKWAVSTAVGQVWQVYVSSIKDSAKDGKLTADEQKVAAQMALDAAKELVTLSGLMGLAAKVFGGEAGLDSVIKHQIEAEVADRKLMAKAGASGN